MKPISEKEVIDELSRLSQKNDQGLTTDEWVDVMGKSLQSTRLMLQKANKLGWLVRGKRTSEAINGRRFQADVYRIVKPDAPPKKRRGT